MIKSVMETNSSYRSLHSPMAMNTRDQFYHAVDCLFHPSDVILHTDDCLVLTDNCLVHADNQHVQEVHGLVHADYLIYVQSLSMLNLLVVMGGLPANVPHAEPTPTTWRNNLHWKRVMVCAAIARGKY